jgi:hypothetical protein
VLILVCRDAPAVSSHLFFTDYPLILMRANRHNDGCLKNIEDYFKASVQMVSESKYNIYFSKNTMVNTRVEVCIILNITVEALLDKYLGLY